MLTLVNIGNYLKWALCKIEVYADILEEIAVGASEQRVKYVDNIKAVAMLLVIAGHIRFISPGLKQWIYAFHVPLFFFASGLVSRFHEEHTLQYEMKFLYKKIETLLIPFLLWALIYCNFTFKNVLKVCYGNISTIYSGGSNGQLWFLPVMFLCVCYFEILDIFNSKHKIHRVSLLVIAGVLFLICTILPKIKYGYPMGLNISFPAFGFLLIGYLAKPFADSARSSVKRSGGVLQHLDLLQCSDLLQHLPLGLI